MRTLTPDEKAKLVNVINEGVKVLQDIQDLREGLKDTVGAVAESMDMKPAIINKAIRAAFKKDLDDQQEVLNEVEEVLVATGITG